jgi:hypothetical protein
MPKKLFKNKHYNIPGHAHELTFSSYNIDFNGKNIGLSLDNRFFWDVS